VRTVGLGECEEFITFYSTNSLIEIVQRSDGGRV